MKRKVTNLVKGAPGIDGAGVKLVRVLGHSTVEEFDPFLMLDSFDSTNPDDYTKGFPLHPHRGIETISYIYKGYMMHKDSIGFDDTVGNGEVQWMTAGSGILHEEKLPASERMLGVQLWLNMSANDKMADPDYLAIKNDMIEDIPLDNGGVLRLLAGKYKNHQGYISKYLPVDYYDIHLQPNQTFTFDTPRERSAFLFTLIGDAKVEGTFIQEKTAAKLSEGDTVTISSNDRPLQILFVSSIALKEPVAWGGPVVMNTQEELQNAFSEIRNGTFIKNS